MLLGQYNLEAYEPKLVNPVLNNIGVNSLRLGGLQVQMQLNHDQILYMGMLLNFLSIIGSMQAKDA